MKDLNERLEESLSNAVNSVDTSDITNLELAIKELSSKTEEIHQKFDNLNEDGNKTTKTDLEVIQSLCLDLKSQLEALDKPDHADLARKEDVAQIRESVQAFRERLEADNELTGQAFEARKIEHSGLATKIDDVRALIGDLRDEVVAKVDGGAEGIDELNKVVGMHHEEMSKVATAEDLSSFSDQLTKELERHMQHHLSAMRKRQRVLQELLVLGKLQEDVAGRLLLVEHEAGVEDADVAQHGLQIGLVPPHPEYRHALHSTPCIPTPDLV